MQLRTPPRAPKGPPPFSHWRARRRLRRSSARPPSLGLFERPLARWRLHREFRRSARESRAPGRSRFAGTVAGPLRNWSNRPRGPLFRGRLDRTLALLAIVVLGGGVVALVLLSGHPAPAGLGRVGANPATPLVVPSVTLPPTPGVPASPTKHHTSKPAPKHTTKVVRTTAPAPGPNTVPAPIPPPQTNPPNPSPHPTTQPPKPSPSPTHTPSPTSSPSPSPSPTSPPPTPTPSLTTPPIPG